MKSTANDLKVLPEEVVDVRRITFREAYIMPAMRLLALHQLSCEYLNWMLDGCVTNVPPICNCEYRTLNTSRPPWR